MENYISYTPNICEHAYMHRIKFELYAQFLRLPISIHATVPRVQALLALVEIFNKLTPSH